MGQFILSHHTLCRLREPLLYQLHESHCERFLCSHDGWRFGTGSLDSGAQVTRKSTGMLYCHDLAQLQLRYVLGTSPSCPATGAFGIQAFSPCKKSSWLQFRRTFDMKLYRCKTRLRPRNFSSIGCGGLGPLIRNRTMSATPSQVPCMQTMAPCFHLHRAEKRKGTCCYKNHTQYKLLQEKAISICQPTLWETSFSHGSWDKAPVELRIGCGIYWEKGKNLRPSPCWGKGGGTHAPPANLNPTHNLSAHICFTANCFSRNT